MISAAVASMIEPFWKNDCSVVYSLPSSSFVVKVTVTLRSPRLLYAAWKVTTGAEAVPPIEAIESHSWASAGISTPIPSPLQLRVTATLPPSRGNEASSGSTDSTEIRDLLTLISVAFSSSIVLP